MDAKDHLIELTVAYIKDQSKTVAKDLAESELASDIRQYRHCEDEFRTMRYALCESGINSHTIEILFSRMLLKIAHSVFVILDGGTQLSDIHELRLLDETDRRIDGDLHERLMEKWHEHGDFDKGKKGIGGQSQSERKTLDELQSMLDNLRRPPRPDIDENK
jgi:hypothetical protein